jgi:hypothetical protein
MEQWREDLLIEDEIAKMHHKLWRYKNPTDGWATFKRDCYNLIEKVEKIKNG